LSPHDVNAKAEHQVLCCSHGLSVLLDNTLRLWYNKCI